jgi:hypothetical protein
MDSTLKWAPIATVVQTSQTSPDIAGTVNTTYLEPQEQPQRVLQDESVEVLDDDGLYFAFCKLRESALRWAIPHLNRCL